MSTGHSVRAHPMWTETRLAGIDQSFPRDGFRQNDNHLPLGASSTMTSRLDDLLNALKSGAISRREFMRRVDAEIEALQDKIARKLGYKLKGHRLELYGVPLDAED